MEHVFFGFAKANYNVGSFGNGMKLKLMANLLVAIHNVSTAEAILMGKNWGIDPATTVKVLADGAGGSRMFSVRGPVMVKENWDEATMKVSIWQKDMKLITAALAQTNTPAPLFAASQAIYNAAMGAGHAENDTAAVYDVLRRMSKLK
jgi:3-hydroxyisobutyrate dehydrogenase-like beta-hydroxyacid dehydrogenase